MTSGKIVIVVAFSLAVLSVSYAASSRYTFYNQTIAVSGASREFVYRHDNWTGHSCLIADYKEGFRHFDIVQYEISDPPSKNPNTALAVIDDALSVTYSPPELCYKIVRRK